MLFIEAEGNNAPRFAVEFHPRITVVSKLTPEMRARLATSLRAALFGDPIDLVMNVDVGGVPQELTTDLLARLGLQRRPLDNVIAAADLPGAIVRQPVAVPAEQKVELSVGVITGGDDSWNSFQNALSGGIADTTHADVEDGPLFDARQELAAAEARLEDIARHLDAARVGRSVEDDGSVFELAAAHAELEDATLRVQELSEVVRGLEQTLPPQRESKVVRVIRLRQAEATINEQIHQLRSSLQVPAEDRSDVQQALEAAVSAGVPQDQDARRSRLSLLSERYHEDRALLEKLENQPRPPQWLIVSTQEQIDEAQARITAFTYQIKEGIDVRKQLVRAQEQLREAQEAWEELQNGIEGEVRSARAHLEESTRNLEAFLGIEPENDIDLEEAIESERDAMQNVTDPRQQLVDALDRQSVDSTPETAAEIAQQWLASQERIDASHAAVQQQLAVVLLDLGDVRKQIADVSAEADVAEELAVDRTQLDAARAQLDSAVREQQRAAEAVAALEMRPTPTVVDNSLEVAALEAQLHEAQELVDAAGRKVDYFARLDALRHDDPVTPASQEVSSFASFDAATSEDEYGTPGRPWWEGRDEPVTPAVTRGAGPAEVKEPEVDLSQISEDDVEMYVLSRSAGLRMAARGESVPMIIDAAFDTLPPHLVVRLFAALAKVSSMVQVVYLSSGNVAEDWVKRQNEMLAAKVTVENR